MGVGGGDSRLMETFIFKLELNLLKNYGGVFQSAHALIFRNGLPTCNSVRDFHYVKTDLL